MENPLNEILGQHEFDGTCWKELRDILQSSLALLPASSVRPAIAFPKTTRPDDIDRAKRQIFAAIGEGHEGCYRAILHSIREHEWPELSDQSIFYLTVCLDQMVAFLDQCFVIVDAKTLSLFPYSQQPEDVLVLWMFFRWWLEGGMMRFVHQAARDRTLFDRYFLPHL